MSGLHPFDSVRRQRPLLAGFWVRATACAIDQMIVITLALALGSLLLPIVSGLLLYEASPQNPKPLGLIVGFLMYSVWILSKTGLAYLLVLDCLYHASFVAFKDATPGKMAMGLRVVNVGGARVGVLRAMARALGQKVSVLAFGIGFLMIGLRADKRGLHDLTAHTQVVYDF